MKQFTFTSQLAPIIWKYLESRQNEGYTSVHCGYYMQELDCLSKELSDAPVVTKELIDAWDLLKPYLSNRSKIVRHNAIRAFAKFAYTQDGISYVPDTSKLKNSSTFTPHIFTVEEIRRLLYAADNLPVRNNAPTRHLVIPAVIRLLYCCGFRIGEVLRLRVKDVDLDTGIITVHNGKGGKDRLVPVHNSVIEYLRSYSAQLPDEREWFFPSACGHYSIKTMLTACNSSRTTLRMLFSSLSVCSVARMACTRNSLRRADGICCSNTHARRCCRSLRFGRKTYCGRFMPRFYGATRRPTRARTRQRSPCRPAEKSSYKARLWG